MAYEDELNEEAVELEEEAAENVPESQEETVNEVSEEALPEETAAGESVFGEEPDTDPTEPQDGEIEFEIENGESEPESKQEKSCPVCNTVQQLRDNIREKYAEARTVCKDLMDRLTYDMEQTNYNPYIRSTTTYKYEILRNSGDTEPVDVFEFERTSGYSLRAMAITSALVAAADIAIAGFFKKKRF